MKNPVIKGWYADPESRVYNGKVYMYVTRSLPFEDQHNLDVVITDDLKTFTKVESILNILGVSSCEVSISHEKQFAVAVVTLKTDTKYNYYINSIKKLKDAPNGTITDDYIKQILKKREPDIHKGDCGRLLIIAGSPCFSGAI